MAYIDKDAKSSEADMMTTSEVADVVHRGDVVKLCCTLQKKNLNDLNKNIDGWFPIHIAVSLGHVDCVKELVRFADDHDKNFLELWDQKLTFHKFSACHVNPLPSPGPEPQLSLLLLAILQKHNQLTKYLVSEYKARIRKLSNIHDALLYSVSHSRLLLYLLQHFPIQGNSNSGTFLMLLREAVTHERCESVKILFDHMNDVKSNLVKCQVELKEMLQFATRKACTSSETETLKVLIDGGADVNYFGSRKIRYNMNDIEVALPLFIAVCCGSLPLVKFLIEIGGADPYTTLKVYITSLRHFLYKVSAIFIAAYYNKVDILQYLISIMDREKLGKLNLTSPVIAAVIKCKPVCLKMLLNSGYRADGILPSSGLRKYKYPCGETMLDSLYIYVDDHKDTKKPVLSVLQILLNSGVKLTAKVDPSFITFIVNYPEITATESLKIFIRAGALEIAFGETNFIEALKKYVLDQWQSVATFEEFEISHPDDPWVLDKRLGHLYVKNIGVIFDYLRLFDVFSNGNAYLVPMVPSLKALCRCAIRCRIVRNHKTLQPSAELPLPVSLIKYITMSS